MSIILGIQNGHHASCAIVKDGILIAGIGQERTTLKKSSGSNFLSNNLPIRRCLQICGITIDQVDMIVSSFQAIGPGGVGLIQPLFDDDFNLFDPYDKRHFVISHHYAHAFSAFGTSGFTDCSILVSDLAGSTTVEGKDFAVPFFEFYNHCINLKPHNTFYTECSSIYHFDEKKVTLFYREFCVPHNSPEIFICSAASLYDNIARFIFNKEDAHGELMALASLKTPKNSKNLKLSLNDIFAYSKEGQIVYNNSWQHKIQNETEIINYVPLASIIQKALESIIFKYVEKTKILTKSQNLAVAGGVFLNIKANSIIEKSKIFSHFHVPSAPHDSGISIGCAFYGWYVIANSNRISVVTNRTKSIDRIGFKYSGADIDDILKRFNHLCEWRKNVSPRFVAQLIAKGNIIARFSGAAEFGPRALGGRSLIANPLLKASKDKLNTIKGRQQWRPVAPIVIKKRINDFFDGQEDSPYMNLSHIIKPAHRKYLKALRHPDHSARVQSLTKEDDSFLYELLASIEELTGYPILINTSLNGRGQPIIETLEIALDFFFASENIDYILIENILVEKRRIPIWEKCRLAQDCIISIINAATVPRYIILRNEKSMEISYEAVEIIKKIPQEGKYHTVDNTILLELYQAAFLQFIIKGN
ncbi:MAG: Carbamoyltransferase [Mucilaginibacter sp.]|nr:Carbamoyltransferase [Mucilaginibacter sp.]